MCDQPKQVQQLQRAVSFSNLTNVTSLTNKTGEYGKLSNKNLEELKAGSRIEVSKLKKNPMDPSEGTTGRPMIALAEVYRGFEGSQVHMESSAGWQDIGVMLEKVIANYSVGMIMHGKVVGSMID